MRRPIWLSVAMLVVAMGLIGSKGEAAESKRIVLPVREMAPKYITLATATAGLGGGDIKLWDVARRIEVATLSGSKGNVWSVSFSPDGQLLASTSTSRNGYDGDIKLWDVAHRTEVATLSGRSVAFSPDGQLLASTSNGIDGDIKLWDVARRIEVATLSGSKGSVSSVAFSPDGRLLASTSASISRFGVVDDDGVIKLWDVASRTEVATLSGSKGVVSVAFSPDGQLLASTSRRGRVGYDGDVKLWDVASRREVATLGNNFGWSVTFSPDGRLLASGGSYGIKFWDVARRTELGTLHAGVITSVAFSPDGRLLASASHDKTIEIWDVVRHINVATLTVPVQRDKSSYGDPQVQSVSFGPDIWAYKFSSDANRLQALLATSHKHAASPTAATRILEQERDVQIAALRSPKGEFETSREYQARTSTANADEQRLRNAYAPRLEEIKDQWARDEAAWRAERYAYTFHVKLGDYGADQETFLAELVGVGVPIAVSRQQAQALKEHAEALVVEGMVRYYDEGHVELVNAVLVDKTANVRIAFGPQGIGADESTIAATAKSPPDLAITSLGLEEPSGNSVLDAGERGAIKVTVKNRGKGAAFGVSLSLDPPSLKGLGLAQKTVIGLINPGEEKMLRVELTAADEIASTGIDIKAALSESNGFDAAPMVLAFKTRELVPPLLQITRVEIAGPEGGRVIGKGKETNLSFTVQNAGKGAARGVVAEITPGDANIKLYSDARTTLGALQPGESKKAIFTVAVTQRYAGPMQLPVSIRLTEDRARFSVTPTIALALNSEAPEIKVIKVEARDISAPLITNAEDINIPPVLALGTQAFGEHDLAVVIGVERYRNNLPKSDYSYNDAKLVKGYLKALGFAERNIELLTDERATLSDIKKTLETWLPNRAKPNSRVLFYYSGHGAPDPASGKGYLVPYDGDPNYLADTGYPLDRLYATLGKLKIAEAIVVTDACFSGAGGRSVLAKGARPLVLTRDPLAVPEHVAVLSAAQGSQISTSAPDKEHGLFTYYFLKAIKDGKKDLGEIYEYLKPQVEDEAKALNVEQTPTIMPEQAATAGKFRVRK